MNSKNLIFEYCNKNIEFTKVITIFKNLEVFVCPIELLYCLKKSHIHIILPLTNDKDKNIELWFRGVNQYLYLKKSCDQDYKELDKIIYEEGKHKYEESILHII